MKENKGLLTIGGIIGLAIITSFAIRSYLDLLRIKRLKQMTKVDIGTDATNLMGDED